MEASPVTTAIFSFGKVSATNAAIALTCRRRQLRRLDHGAVARGECGRERYQRQRQRVVPWSHNADNTERLVLDVRACEPHVKRDVSALASHEAAQILLQVVDAPREREYLHDGGLVPGAVSKVGDQRRFQNLPAGDHRRAKPVQICPALSERWGPVSQKGCALPCEQSRECVGSCGNALMRLMRNDGAIDVESCASIVDACGTELELRSVLCCANSHDPAPGFALVIVLGIERRAARSFGDVAACRQLIGAYPSKSFQIPPAS